MDTKTCKTIAVLGGLGTLVHAERTAELACHLCEGYDVDLILAYPIIVPQSMPLNVPLPDQERAAKDAIALGMQVAARFGCRTEYRIFRHRRPADAILELAKQERAERIVLGIRINPNVPHDMDRVESAESEILHRAECEVIVNREPIVA